MHGWNCPCPPPRNMSYGSRHAGPQLSCHQGCAEWLVGRFLLLSATGKRTVYGPRMEVAELAHLRRARDFLDREYARPLDVPVMARVALMSPSLFSRRFREAYGDTPYSYLQARRVERAMALLRSGHMSVTDVCIAVGFTSLGSFSSTFTRLAGEPPSVYKARDHSRLAPVPPCMTRAWARPGWIAQPCRIGEAFPADRA